jgi:hypothetical protein
LHFSTNFLNYYGDFKMKFKMLILSLSLILLSISVSYSNHPDCFPDCDKISRPPITYSVDHFDCGTCFYDVYYQECIINGISTFLIDSVLAHNTNLECCQGTATNNPVVSGYILDEAGLQISLTGVGADSFSVYTPSRCWKWEGTLGPYGIHNAVLVYCDEDFSCCELRYRREKGEMIFWGWRHYGPENCDLFQACMQICD